MKKLLLFIIAILVLTPNLIVFGDTREEFRGVWVSTVLNLDFPKSFDEKAQKEEIIKILDTCRDLNTNAVFFQVKPAGDAFYKSKYLPYSEYLTGEFGKEPSYDVLAFFIEEAKKRGIELHAWFNPYRVSMNTTGESVTSGKSLVKKYPQWVKIANNRYVFDPGIPKVREFIINCVMEVVENYDIAGVHFDDYFYYESDSSKLDDDETFKKYGGGFENKDDWRRNNTYLLIKELRGKINSVKPQIKFGISPSGVWRNKSDDEEGSDTGNAYSHYDRAYIDTIKLVEENLIDYIAPQIYWSHTYPGTPYGTVAKWWEEVLKNKNCHLYVGLAAYKINDNEDIAWHEDDGAAEIAKQIQYNQESPVIKGSILFRYESLITEKNKKAYEAVKSKWNEKAQVPQMEWKNKKTPKKPGVEIVDDKIYLKPDENAEKFIIYKTNGEGETVYQVLTNTGEKTLLDLDFTKSYKIVAVSQNEESEPLILEKAEREEHNKIIKPPVYACFLFVLGIGILLFIR